MTSTRPSAPTVQAPGRESSWPPRPTTPPPTNGNGSSAADDALVEDPLQNLTGNGHGKTSEALTNTGAMPPPPAATKNAVPTVPMGKPLTPPPRVPPTTPLPAGATDQDKLRHTLKDLQNLATNMRNVEGLAGRIGSLEQSVTDLMTAIKTGDNQVLKEVLSNFNTHLEENLYGPMRELQVAIPATNDENLKLRGVFDEVVINLNTVTNSLGALTDPESESIKQMAGMLGTSVQIQLQAQMPHIAGIKEALTKELASRGAEIVQLSQSLQAQEGLLKEMLEQDRQTGGKVDGVATQLGAVLTAISDMNVGVRGWLGNIDTKSGNIAEDLREVRIMVKGLVENPPVSTHAPTAPPPQEPAVTQPSAEVMLAQPSEPQIMMPPPAAPPAEPPAAAPPQAPPPPAGGNTPPPAGEPPAPPPPPPTQAPVAHAAAAIHVHVGGDNSAPITIGGAPLTRNQYIAAAVAAVILLAFCGSMYACGKPAPRYGDADMSFPKSDVIRVAEAVQVEEKEISEGDFKVKLAKADLAETQLETCLLDSVIRVKESGGGTNLGTASVKATLEQLNKEKPDDRKWSEGLAYFHDHIALAESDRLGSAFPGAEKLLGSARVATGAGGAIGEFGILPSSAQWACNLNPGADLNQDKTCNPYDPKEGRAIALVLTRQHIQAAHRKVVRFKEGGGQLRNTEFVQTIAVGLADYSGNSSDHEPDAIKYANLAITQCMKQPPITTLYLT